MKTSLNIVNDLGQASPLYMYSVTTTPAHWAAAEDCTSYIFGANWLGSMQHITLHKKRITILYMLIHAYKHPLQFTYRGHQKQSQF